MSESNVTVYVEVFNEESRIESCLKSFSWADELVVFDKCSTDMTREIASKYATQLITVPNTPASENIIENFSKCKITEWLFVATASSLIHPKLVDEIIKLTTDENFKYDVIAVPYAMHAFGINNKNSPWTNLRKNSIIRSSVLSLSCELHNEITYNSDRVFEMPLMAPDEALYHCTHKNAGDFFSRHMRYVNYEAQYQHSQLGKQQLKKSFIDIFRAIATVLIKRRTFMLGWDGIALSLAYVSYFIMKFIYVWDVNRENGDVVYPELRKKIDRLWDSERNN